MAFVSSLVTLICVDESMPLHTHFVLPFFKGCNANLNSSTDFSGVFS